VFKRTFLSISLFTSIANAQILIDITNEIIQTNPEIQEKVHYYNSVKKEYKFARSGLMPTINLDTSFGEEYTKSKSTNYENLSLFKTETSLTLIQNVFNGFKTTNEIDEQKARYLSASFSIIEKINSIALQVSEIYINILKYKKNVQLNEKNIATHETILAKIKAKVDSGFSPRSDMLQIETRYAKAKTDLIAQQNNLKNELIKFHKMLGRFLYADDFIEPSNSFILPKNIDEATEKALEIHPALKIANFNVKAKKYAYEKEKKGNYPSVDFVLKAEKNSNVSAVKGETDRYYAGIKLQYNLFSGFADEDTIQKNVSIVNQENSLLKKIKRQIIESVRLSWRNYNSLLRKETVLKKHVKFADKAREAYSQEFAIGKRSLLDILNIEDEYNNAEKSDMDNHYTMLYTKYKLMESMGVLSKELGLSTINESNDTLPLNLEVDKDGIADMQDICDQTIEPLDINMYGCKNFIEPIKKKIIKPKIKPKPKPKIIKKPKIYIPKVKKKIEAKIAEVIKRDIEKKRIHFQYKSTAITKKSLTVLSHVIELMLDDSQLVVELYGYADNVGSQSYNKKLALKRAQIVKDYLIEQGVLASNIAIYSEGENSPVATNETSEGRRKNRRVEIVFTEFIEPILEDELNDF